jgi:hypothetical protein
VAAIEESEVWTEQEDASMAESSFMVTGALTGVSRTTTSVTGGMGGVTAVCEMGGGRETAGGLGGFKLAFVLLAELLDSLSVSLSLSLSGPARSSHLKPAPAGTCNLSNTFWYCWGVLRVSRSAFL